MANIAKDLPTGQAIGQAAASRGKARKGAYGAHCYAIVDALGLRVDLTLHDGTLLAAVSGPAIEVSLADIAKYPDTVPYVNRFLSGHGQRVETYWRTKQLRIVPTKVAKAGAAVSGATRPVAPATAKPKPAPVAAPAPAVAAPMPAPVAPAPVAAPVPTTAPVRTTDLVVDKVEYTVFDDGTTIPKKHHRVLLRALAQRAKGRVAAVLVTGPSGTAKTVAIAAFARSVGYRLVTVQGLAIETASDWFGQTIIDKDGTRFVLSPFGQALADGATNVIVLLDEANRAQSAAALNAVLSLLDRQGHVFVPGYGTLVMPTGLLVAVTANMGAEYVGVQQFDAAVRQRFAYGIRTGYLPETVEVAVLNKVGGVDVATAETLVRMAGQQRPLRLDYAQFPSGTGLSTRMLVDVAVQVADGAPVREALESLADAQFDVEDMTAFNTLLDSFFPDQSNATFVPSLDDDADSL